MTEGPFLILLVGSNPLPNYLVARLLAPRAVRLVYTPETEEPMKRLRTALREIVRDVDPRCVGAAEPSQTRNALSDIPRDAHLDYTGGTKVMAAHARMAFREARGEDERASYVDERAGVLRRDNGFETSLTSDLTNLTFQTIADLHGCQVSDQANGAGPLPRADDATGVLKAVLRDPALAERLHCEGVRLEGLEKPSKAVSEPFRCGENDLGILSVEQIPAGDWARDTFKAWWRFLKGEWLELQVKQWVRELVQAELRQGVHCTLPSGREFEVDVVLVRGHRFFLVSCTTDATLARCKSKLFEVALRARQLGGDLARSALVCLIDGENARGRYVEQLRNDVESVWEAPNTPRVFGAADLREWAGLYGEHDLRTLRDWLDS